MYHYRRALLPLIVGGIFILLVSCDDENDTTSDAERSTTVTSFEAQERNLSQEFSVSAEVQAYQKVFVASRISGVVEEVNFEEGEVVEQGETMARLDVRQHQAELRRAEAVLDEARDSYEASKKLYERDAISRSEYLEDKRDYEQADSEVELLQLNVDFGEIKSPTDAIVTQRHIEVGNSVSENERVFDIADHDMLVIRPGVSEINLGLLDEGDNLDVNLDVYPDRTFSGSIRRIFPERDETSRLFTVEVELDQEEDKPVIRPGYLARPRFAADEDLTVTVVPSEAVIEREDTYEVFILGEDQRYVTSQTVEIGIQRDGYTEIRSGLEKGTQIAASNVEDLEDQSRVNVVGEFRRHGFRN